MFVYNFYYLGRLLSYDNMVELDSNFNPSLHKHNVKDNIDTKLLVARTFTKKDLDVLLRSFEKWSQFPPCSEQSNAGLLLYFSGKLSDFPHIEAELKKISDNFETNSLPWHKCFSEIIFSDAQIPIEKDIYNSSQQEQSLDWVLGPNLHFNHLLRDGIFGKFGDYSHMYLMEGDSIPIKENWLDAIVNECQNYEDFAIFGSRYRGDNWADFLNLMPDAMKYHINGNAVYNFNHPKTLELLFKLEDELETEKRATAYDVRIVELLMKENSIENLNKTIYRDSPIFANYAGTYLVEELNLGQEYVAHGFRSRALWPEDVGIDLVISDWGNSQVDTILNDLEKVSHPFKNIYIYSDELNEPKEELSKTGLKIHRIKRNGHHPGEDWCVAPVSSNWLMYTNSYYTVSNIQLQVKKLQGQLFGKRPIIQRIEKKSFRN